MKLSINKQATNKVIGGSGSFDLLSKSRYWQTVDFSLQSLIDHISEGFPWMPSVIDEGKDRKAQFCNYAEFLAIDVDNTAHIKGEDGIKTKVYAKELTIEEALAHPFLSKYCAIAIPSASHTNEWHKFRLIFALSYPLPNQASIESAYKYLLEIFPCGDKACKDSSRFFYGAKGATAFIHQDVTLSDDFLNNVFSFEAGKAREESDRLIARQKWIKKNDAANDSEELILSALDAIPTRQVGGNTYLALRDSLWALIHELGESKAIEIMESHSPSGKGWDIGAIAKAYDANRSVGIGTLFYHAKDNGWRFPQKPQPRVKASSSTLLTKSGAVQVDTEYSIQLCHIASRPTKDLLQGCTGRVSVEMLSEAIQDLKASLSILPKDTIAPTSIDRIIKELADRYDFKLDSVKSAIALSVPSKPTDIPIKPWRTRIYKTGTEEEITRKDTEEKLNQSDRVFAELRDRVAYDQETASWYLYDRGVWIMASLDATRRAIRDTLRDLSCSDSDLRGVEPTSRVIAEQTEAIKLLTQVEKLNTAPKNLINLRDGILDRSTFTLTPHNPKLFFSWQLPIAWKDRSNGCKEIIDWLKWALNDQYDQVTLLLCYLNAIVTGRADTQKFLQLVGAGGSGKSTFAKIAIALVGAENHRKTDMHTLDTNQFESANFINKKLVCINEIGNYRGTAETLRNMTGGDFLRNEIKNVQSRNGGFIYKGMVLITGEKEFTPNDPTGGFHRRNICVRFDRFVEQHHQVPLIDFDDIGNASGTFVKSLPALLELVLSIDDTTIHTYLKQTDLAVKSLNLIAGDSIVNGNSIAQWAEDNLVLVPDSRTQVGVAKKVNVSTGENGQAKVTRTIFEKADIWLYANYCDHYVSRGGTPVVMQSFSQKFLDLFNNQLKNSSVSKGKDRSGACIFGVMIRGSEHSHLPSPVKGCDEVGASTKTVESYSIPNVLRDLFGLTGIGEVEI